MSERIRELQDQLELVYSEFNLLLADQSELYQHLEEELLCDLQRQIIELTEWGENERKAAERNFNSEMKSAETERQFDEECCHDRAIFLIKHKLNRLIHAMPSTASYFMDKDCPFINEVMRSLNLTPDEEVSQTKDFSLSSDTRFRVPQLDGDEPDTYAVSGKGALLINNKSVAAGTSANLKFAPDMDHVRGVIKTITKDYIDFTPSGRATIRISLDALRYNLASLTV